MRTTKNSQLLVKCDECDQDFAILDNLSQEKVGFYDVDGNNKKTNILLTYIQCSNCGAIYPVMVDDKKTLYWQKRYEEMKTEDKRKEALDRSREARRKLAEKLNPSIYEICGRRFIYNGLYNRDIQKNGE